MSYVDVVRRGDDGSGRRVEVLEDGAHQPSGDSAAAVTDVDGHVLLTLDGEDCKCLSQHVEQNWNEPNCFNRASVRKEEGKK